MAFAIEAVRYGLNNQIICVRWRAILNAPEYPKGMIGDVDISVVLAAAKRGHMLFLDTNDIPRNKVVPRRTFLSGMTLVDGPDTKLGMRLKDLPVF